MEKRFFVYFFAFFQWLIFIVIILPFVEYPTIVVGTKDDGAIKIVKPFHLWILAISAILSALFYKIKTKNGGENYVTFIALLATFFSCFDLILHFVNGLSLWMNFTRSITDGLYFALAAISAFKVFLQATRYFASYFRRSLLLKRRRL